MLLSHAPTFKGVVASNDTDNTIPGPFALPAYSLTNAARGLSAFGGTMPGHFAELPGIVLSVSLYAAGTFEGHPQVAGAEAAKHKKIRHRGLNAADPRSAEASVPEKVRAAYNKQDSGIV